MNKRITRFIILTFIIVIFSACSESRPPVQVDKANLVYFQESYNECRKAFLAAADELKAKYLNTEIASIKVAEPGEDDLFIDTCYIPAQKHKERIILLMSGLHGIEGFAGSAVQQYVMKVLVPTWDLEKTGVLLVHGLNPYGFKHERRVSKRNIDLNRNFSVDGAFFKLKNEGYKKVYGLLNPQGKADAGSLSNRFFPVKAAYNIVKYSMKALRDAALRGQYQFEKGIYYGGNKSEPQKEIIDSIINGAPRDYRAVLALELHTGYGERNTMHLFPNPQKDNRIKGAMEEVFKGYKVDWGDQGDFYETTGDLMGYLEKTLAPKMFFVPMVFEFGTMDSQTTMGSIRSIQAVILENQGIQFGYDSDADRKEIKNRFREAYYPSSPEWRSEVIRQVKEGFPVFVDRFMKLKI
jgi:hypothetical protein